MRNKIALASFALALLSFGPRLHASCTNATMLGNWGFTGTGVVIVPTGGVPVAAVGDVHFDLEGGVSGDQNRSLGGEAGHETFFGTYSISGDCALTITVNVYDDSGTLQRTTVLKGIVVNNGKESRMLYQTITLPNGSLLPSVLTLVANKR